MKALISTAYFSLLLMVFSLVPTQGLKAQFATDLGIIEVLMPVTDCEIINDSVSVTLFNFGTLPQSLIPFRFSINDEEVTVFQPLDGFYTGIIAPDSMVTLTFEATYDFSEDGLYVLKAWTEVETDMDTSNDTLTYLVENITLVEAFPYNNNFTQDYPEGWYPDVTNNVNSTWEYGAPNGVILNSAFTQQNTLITSTEGNYNNNELSYVPSPCMDFSNFSEDPVFKCAIFYETENNFDGAWLEGSIDGGMTWAKIGAMGMGTNWYNVDITNSTNLGQVWNGSSDEWLEAESVMEGYAGQPDVRLRFAFDSDGSITREGVAIDDISIEGCLNSFNTVFDVLNASEEATADGSVVITGGEGVGPFAYTWSTGETTDNISNLMAGEYGLTIVDALGCSDETIVTVGVGIGVATTEIGELATINVYPNPTHGITLLELDFEKATDFTATVMSSVGERVLQIGESNSIGGKYEMDLTALSPGIYFVQVRLSNGGSHTERVVVL